MQRTRLFLGSLSSVLLVVGFSIALMRVYALERSELSFEGTPRSLDELANAPGSTPSSARLARIELRAGEQALFELCASDPLTAAHWTNAFDLAVLRWPKPELLLRVPLDAAHLERAQRSSSRACVTLGGGPITLGGVHTLEAVWPERPPPPATRSVPLQARVLAYAPIGLLERAAIVALVLGIGLLLAWLLSAPSVPAQGPEREPSARASPGRTALLSIAALCVIALCSFLPLYGSTLGLLKGALLLLLHAGAAFVLAGSLHGPRGSRGSRTSALALGRPKRLLAWLGAAILSALLLSQTAKLALQLVPSTGEAPIEGFVRFPSGMLAFAAIGVLVPIGEELFFRGLLYRAALPLGTLAACTLSLVAFVALHVAQSFGNWGGLLAIAITGAVLTLLRALSRSVLVPAVAHLLYNSALSLGALSG